MNQLPVRIYKHWIGYIVIALAGVGLLALLWFACYALSLTPGIDDEFILSAASVAMLFVVLATAVQLFVYGLSYMELNKDFIVMKNWTTLFVSKNETFEWVSVSRSTVDKPGIFSQIFGYGTIGIETNGGAVQAKITLMPDPTRWQSLIDQVADLATEDGTDSAQE